MIVPMWRDWRAYRRSRDEVARIKAEVRERKFDYTLWHPLFWRYGLGIAPVGLLGFFPFMFCTLWSYLAAWAVLYGLLDLCFLVPPADRIYLSGAVAAYLLYTLGEAVLKGLRNPERHLPQHVESILINLLVFGILFWLLRDYAVSSSDHLEISWIWVAWMIYFAVRDLRKWRRPDPEKVGWWQDCWQGRGYANLF